MPAAVPEFVPYRVRRSASSCLRSDSSSGTKNGFVKKCRHECRRIIQIKRLKLDSGKLNSFSSTYLSEVKACLIQNFVGVIKIQRQHWSLFVSLNDEIIVLERCVVSNPGTVDKLSTRARICVNVSESTWLRNAPIIWLGLADELKETAAN